MADPQSRTASTDAAAQITFSLDAFQAVDRRQWDRLFRASRTSNLFYDYRVIEAARLAWKKYRTLEVVCGYRDGELVFLLPVRIIGAGLLKALELLSLPTADSNEPLCRPDQREQATSACLDFIATRLRPAIILAKSVSPGLYSDMLVHYGTSTLNVKRVRESRVLSLPSSVDDYWAALKSGARNQLKRKINRAVAEGFEFRVIDSGSATHEELRDALDRLTQLHRMRFASMQRDSFFVNSDFQQFHRALCERHTDAPVVFTFTEALLAGDVVGSIYGMRNDQAYVYLMIGFNPALSVYSVGNVLIYRTIEDLVARRIGVFDFKCGKEAYKRWWTREFYHNHDVTICLDHWGKVADAALDGVKLAGRAGRAIPRVTHRCVHRAAGMPAKIFRVLRSSMT